MREPASANADQNGTTGLKPHPIRLFGSVAHRLPKIVNVNGGALADETTMEIELETDAGHRVLLPLSGAAIEDLVDVFLQAVKSKDGIA